MELDQVPNPNETKLKLINHLLVLPLLPLPLKRISFGLDNNRRSPRLRKGNRSNNSEWQQHHLHPLPAAKHLRQLLTSIATIVIAWLEASITPSKVPKW